MINAMSVLLICQLAGELVSRSLGLPIPGPVLGLILLTALLLAVPALRNDLDTSPLGRLTQFLTGTMGILFVPAGVGVVEQFGQLQHYAVPLVATIILSTAITLLCTVGTFIGVKRLMGGRA